MTCREFADFIMDYTSGELPDDVRALFERHLSRCADCHTYLAEYNATRATGREAFADQTATVPDDVPEDLIRAILAARRS